MRVYEKVRAYIDDHDLEEVTVAQKSEISIDMFHAMMNGEQTMYVDDLRSICHALSVNPETFIEPKSA